MNIWKLTKHCVTLNNMFDKHFKGIDFTYVLCDFFPIKNGEIAMSILNMSHYPPKTIQLRIILQISQFEMETQELNHIKT